MKYSKKCPCCGHVTAAYTYKLNKCRLATLRKIIDAYEQKNSAVGRKDLVLSNVEYSTLPHLQFWGFIQIAPQGYYPTRQGVDFIYGRISVPETVAVLENEILPPEHEAWATHNGSRRKVMVWEIDETAFKQRPEYQAEKSSQLTMAL